MMPDFDSPKGYYYVERKNPSNYGFKPNQSEKYKREDLLYGVFKGKIKALKPLAFTQNVLTIYNGKPTYLLQREAGKIVLPGSQLKGAIKTYMQSLSESYDEEVTQINNNTLDMVNSITGYMGYTSRIMFKDIVINENEVKPYNIEGKQQWSQAKKLTRTNKIRLYSHKKHEDLDRAVNFEVLPTGTILDFEILFNGLNEEEIGLVFMAMGLDVENKFSLKLGRGKNLDMGSIIIIPEKIIMPKNSLSKSKKGVKKENIDDFLSKKIKSYKINMNENQKNILDLIHKDSSEVITK
jgi:CRISPR/Cas system CSM-associated protein Csm3 (group 7 of RAMP superfamily)